MTVADDLRASAADVWEAQHAHPFVRGIGDGTLDLERFRHYVRQDYLFLADYGRFLALGAARAPRLEEIRRFATLAHAVLETEMELHRQLAGGWGVSPEELERERPTATTRAYADFLLRTATLADYAELTAALLPCMWGYHEVGLRLAEKGSRPEGLYARWIDVYAGEEFATLAAWARDLVAAAAAAGDIDRMTEAFVESSRHELAFWDASWRLEPPLPAPRSGRRLR